jgi:cytoskeleton protein RodZ
MTDHKEEIGNALRAARQAAGLSLKDIAGQIRIRPIYLQAIEAGQFELLPALPQTIGFTRAYARHLHVDVEEPLSHLGEEVHRDIEKADYSEPELPWTVSPRRLGYVGAGVVSGLALLALAVIDVGPPVSEIVAASDPNPVFVEPPAASSPVASARAGNTLVMKIEPVRPASAPVTAALASRPLVTAPAEFHDTTYRPEPVSAPGENLSVSGSNSDLAAEEPAQAGAGAGDADFRFVTGSVYFRAKPDNAGAEIGVLDACEQVVFLGTDGTDYWREVRRADGTSGWVFRDYVAGDKPAVCS